ncbi:DUF3426 domain-containing protein [Thiobacter aerophilum]|uniref:DUF3426 domain-containing protein n=1 Tax=Thiobacter aerophilum TaxID=3121275 RepID=A0ABV0EDB2_9BURK
MSMQTTCPSCQTVFRVTTEQLDMRAGKVRCGKCAFVFNAFDTLVTPIETVSLMAPSDGAPASEHITLKPAPLSVAEPLTASFPLPTDEQIERETEEINRSIAETDQLESLRPREDRGRKRARPRLEITPELKEKLENLQEELTLQEKRARRRRLAWAAGSLLLAVVALLEVAYFQRVWLASRYPQIRPALEFMCGLARCKIGLPAEAEKIRLESSELKADAERPQGVLLTATLRNLAPWPMAYPHLELTLTDSNSRPVARRHFGPRDYLPTGVQLQQGMPPNEEVTVKLSLEVVGVDATGYKLFVYYPQGG